MINILPPDLKEQITYSRRNVVARRYVFVLIFIILVTGSILTAIHWYADQQIAAYEAALEERTEEISQFENLETSVDTLNTQIDTIDTVLKQRPQFSILLADLAQVLPQGSYLNGISLSEETDQPLQLTITAPSRDQAVRVRQALLQSPRIGSADIQSITSKPESDRINVNIIIAFETGDGS